MSENEIKPVAWISDDGRPFKTESEARRNSWNNATALYDQSAIDRLTAERDAAVAARVADSHKVSNVGKVLAGVDGTDPLGCSPATYLLKLAVEMVDAARAEGGV